VDWETVYERLMFGRMRMRPWEVERLTPAELSRCLDEPPLDGKPRAPKGATALAPWDVQEYARQWRSMTLKDRLEQARRK
jgi:hypothetical protein